MQSMNQSCRELNPKAQSCLSSIHTFLLQPFDNNTYYQQSVALDFSPIYNEQGKQFKVLPIFNQDGNVKTPAFLTELDKKNLQLFAQLSNQSSKKILNPNPLQKCQIYQPKPLNNFCFVCKEPYIDYMKHIDHKIHKKNLEANCYTKQIEQLAKYHKRTKLNSKLMKKFSHNNSLDQQSYKQHTSKKRRIVETKKSRIPIPVIMSKETASESTHISHCNEKKFHSFTIDK